MNDNPSSVEVSPLHFFALTFLFSWLIWIPLDLSHYGIGPFPVLENVSGLVRLLGVLIPAAVAIFLTGKSGGGRAVKGLLSRLGIWRVGWKWWAAATLVYPLLLVITVLAYNTITGTAAVSFTWPSSLSFFLVNIIFLLIAALGEEIGWRGVALPQMQRKRSALVSSIILGLCWGFWHLPFWLLMDSIDQFGLGYLVLDFLLLPLTFYITWLYNHSQASLLIPVAFHLTFNIVNTALLPVTNSLGTFILFVLLNWIVTLLILGRLEPAGKQAVSAH
jgi:hypothetical protein